VDVDICPLLVSPLNALLENKTGVLSSLAGSVNQVKAICGMHGPPASFPVLEGYTEKYTDITTDTYRFRVSGKSFFQANRHLHHHLGTWARSSLSGNYCIDLFGGTGFFSCMLGDLFSGGIMVDHDSDQVILAKKNLMANNIRHFRAKAVFAEDFLRLPLPFPPDQVCMILDPPRTGLSRQVLSSITRILPRQVIYISCNPSTLARDSGELTRTGKYSISRIALFDCFPQTHHIECGIVLGRKM
jgi:23S rRNA (uracil1939-C5)-methyltransferase